MNISSANSLTLGIASFRSQALTSIFSSASNGSGLDYASIANQLLASGNSPATNTTAAASGTDANALSSLGRNQALNDPESAYKMMTIINRSETTYKAQYYEMSQMSASVAKMQGVGEGLGGISTATGNDEIQKHLQDFAEQYNQWLQRFNQDVQPQGILAGTQAAQVARHELEQSVENRFFGVRDGLHGLSDLGLSVDEVSGQIVLDGAKLNSVLSTNKQGVVDTLQEFSANFAESARLLNSAGNFIPQRLDNLDRAIDYISDNKSSLQAEFGMGDPAKPNALVAKALAAYQQNFGY